MQIWRNKFWLGCCLILIVHQVIQKVFDYNIAIFDNYLDPLLGMPILLGFILQERQLLLTKVLNANKLITYQFSILEIISISLFFALIFEEGFPEWSPYFTKDYWDYLAYASGAFLFYIFINKKLD